MKTTVIGKTEEGREIMVVHVTSEANLRNLEANRANMRQARQSARAGRRLRRKTIIAAPSRTITSAPDCTAVKPTRRKC